MEWFGRARITFHHHASPLALQNKDGSATDLLKVVEQSTPPCQLNPLLFNGHLQTMWSAVATSAPLVYYRRKLFESDHKLYFGSFAVDFAVKQPHGLSDNTLPPRTAYYSEDEFANISSDDSRPMLIVLHGLSGGSYELYLRHCIAPLLVDGQDWEICVVNSRGCAKSAITSGVLFNARSTWDVRQIVNWARQTFPNRPLFGLGFSFGANILTNYAGEEGVDCVLKAVVVVGNPFDMCVASKFLQNSLIGKEVYLRFMAGNVKRLAFENWDQIQERTNIDRKYIERNVTYLHEFDRAVQCPTWGYPTEQAYYRDASSTNAVLAIRIPYLAIQAEDDPIAVRHGVPYEEFKQNPYTVLCSPSLGGHLSFFELGGGRWHGKPVSNFLKNMATQINLDSAKPQKNGDNTAASSSRINYDPMRRAMIIRAD